MSEDVWSASDTTPDAIEAALRELLRKRHAENEQFAPARVLNLVVVVDRDWKGEIANRLERVGRYHASRTVLCAVQEKRTTLDAVAAIGFAEPAPGGGCVMREQVEIDMGPEHLDGLETIVDPVLVSELQTMLWCPHGHVQAIEALRKLTDVILLDSDEGEDELGLDDAEALLRWSYVVDLAWLRTTPWRERLASTFDPLDRRSALNELESVTIRYRPSSQASALMLAGWLASRLGWQPTPLEGAGGGLRAVARVDGEDAEREVVVELDPHEQEAPGLAGVTVAWGGVASVSLDRHQGGLRACEVKGDEQRVWQVLGASRGEGGILGEGVRQALLRDPTYRPALDAARRFAPGLSVGARA